MSSTRQPPPGPPREEHSASPFHATLEQADALYRAGRAAEALDRCRRVLAPSGSLLVFAGRLAMEIGSLEEGVAYYRAVTALYPNAVEVFYNLGNALTRLGRGGEAVDAYRRAAQLRPELVEVQSNLAVALQALGRWDEAIAVYRTALDAAPGAPELHRNLGIALERVGRRGEAIDAYRRGVALKPDWPLPYQNLATALLEEGEAGPALEVCDAWLRVAPGTIEAVGLKSVALEELGEHEQARFLVDLDRFVRVVHFETPPPGFASMAALNAELTRDILAHSTLRAPADDDPHYNGPGFTTTEEMFGPTSGAWAALEKMVRDQIADYLTKEAAPDPSHPFLSHQPASWRPSAYGTVLQHLAKLAPHIHYDGYVSGVYYCQLPEIAEAGNPTRAGWLEIGRPQARFHRRGAPEIRAVRPREGTMVLFPSYFLHNTVPFQSDKARVSIAIDAIPMSGPRAPRAPRA